MGNSRGMVVKAFAADSDEEEESEEVRRNGRGLRWVKTGGVLLEFGDKKMAETGSFTRLLWTAAV